MMLATYDTLSAVFQAAVARLNLEKLEPVLYSLRHGGASHDAQEGRLLPPAIQKRGAG